MTVRLALMRHGVTAWNRAHRIQGRSDIPLDDQARADLDALQLPDPWGATALWSSPLTRARETAEHLTGRTPQTSDALIEMNWGDWEGQKGTELRADPDSGFKDIEDWGWDYCPPGGESPRQVRTRLEPWLTGLTEDALAICHIGTMRVILALATGWDFDGPCPFSVKRNRLYVVEHQNGAWRLIGDPIRLTERST